MENNFKPHFTFNARTQFDELDALWVLHHSRFVSYAERAQHAFFLHLLETEAFDPEAYPDLYVLVKNVECTFQSPLKGCVDFCIHLQVTRLREAGLTVAFQFTSPDRETIYAEGRRTVCRMSTQNHQPTGWSPTFREKLEALSIG